MHSNISFLHTSEQLSVCFYIIYMFSAVIVLCFKNNRHKLFFVASIYNVLDYLLAMVSLVHVG